MRRQAQAHRQAERFTALQAEREDARKEAGIAREEAAKLRGQVEALQAEARTKLVAAPRTWIAASDVDAQAIACDTAAFNRFFHAMLERGVYLAPSAYDAGFMSSAHDASIIADTLTAARSAFQAIGTR